MYTTCTPPPTPIAHSISPPAYLLRQAILGPFCCIFEYSRELTVRVPRKPRLPVHFPLAEGVNNSVQKQEVYKCTSVNNHGPQVRVQGVHGVYILYTNVHPPAPHWSLHKPPTVDLLGSGILSRFRCLFEHS